MSITILKKLKKKLKMKCKIMLHFQTTHRITDNFLEVFVKYDSGRSLVDEEPGDGCHFESPDWLG